MRVPVSSRALKGAFLALFLIHATLVPGGPAAPPSAEAAELFARERLQILRKDGKQLPFHVELAVTGAQREQGLMFRKMMGETEGMLFDFGESRLVTMWMRNTVLPLDMVFMDAAGRITHIHEGAVPFSEAIISSVDPVRYVLELNAGTVRQFEIREGDRAQSPLISKAN